MKDTEIRNMLEELGKALSQGDSAKIAELWEIPALVLSDDGAMPVSDSAQVEKFFSRAVAWYHNQGLASTRPELQRVERLSPTVASVDVRWPAYDAEGHEKSSERSHYLVHEGKDGQPRIQVALSMAE